MSEPTPRPWPKPEDVGIAWEIAGVAHFNTEADAMLAWQSVNERDAAMLAIDRLTQGLGEQFKQVATLRAALDEIEEIAMDRNLERIRCIVVAALARGT